jgi:hypothetical protein
MKAHSTRRKGRRALTTVRRSFAIPARLIEEVLEATPADGPGNLNAIVRCALAEYVARRKDEEFGREMERMAADPEIQRENESILRDFAGTTADGLERFPWTGGRPSDPEARSPKGRRK